MNSFLCTIDEVGRLKPFLGVPKPSFSCPAISIHEVEVAGLEVGRDGTILADFSVWGVVAGGRYDFLADGAGEPRELGVYVNGEDTPIATVPITVQREIVENWKRPHGYNGSFAFSMKKVPVTEGVNTLELQGYDGLTVLASRSMIAVTFGMEEPADWDGEDYSKCTASIESDPEIVHQCTDGEYELYTIAVADISPSAMPLSIGIMGESGVATMLPTAIDSNSGWHYACVEGTRFPQMFSFALGENYDLRAGGEPKANQRRNN